MPVSVAAIPQSGVITLGKAWLFWLDDGIGVASDDWQLLNSKHEISAVEINMKEIKKHRCV